MTKFLFLCVFLSALIFSDVSRASPVSLDLYVVDTNILKCKNHQMISMCRDFRGISDEYDEKTGTRLSNLDIFLKEIEYLRLVKYKISINEQIKAIKSGNNFGLYSDIFEYRPIGERTDRNPAKVAFFVFSVEGGFNNGIFERIDPKKLFDDKKANISEGDNRYVYYSNLLALHPDNGINFSISHNGQTYPFRFVRE